MLGEWLKKNCLANNIWWALNPGSGDTGTSDIETLEQAKQAPCILISNIIYKYIDMYVYNIWWALNPGSGDTGTLIQPIQELVTILISITLTRNRPTAVLEERGVIRIMVKGEGSTRTLSVPPPLPPAPSPPSLS